MFDESKFWNINDSFKGLELSAIQEAQVDMSLPYAVAVVNLNGDLNTGVIIRTAVLMGAREIFVFGRRKFDKRSTVGAQNYIPVHKITALLDEETPDYSKIFGDIIAHGYTPVLVEQGGTKVRDYNWPKNPCIVLGNESTGFPPEIVSQWDTVTIPQRGVLRSLNVSTAAGIVMEHLSYSLS